MPIIGGNMDKKTSLYLDSLRVIATVLVFVGHFSYKQFSGGYLEKVGMFPHDAVIIFFVLSGFVITYVIENKDKNIKDYFLSRFARIYSVLLPALILTLVLDIIGREFSAGNYIHYGTYNLMEVLEKTFANGMFLQEIGNQSIRFFSNGPLWSLGYEVIYYVIFGLLYYKGKSNKLKFGVGLLLVVFYKVSLLFPIWLLGSFAYKLKDKNIFSKKMSYFLFITTPIVFILFKKFGILSFVDIPSLGYSRLLVGDYITGIILFINILSIRNMKLELLEKCSIIIKYFANFSFSIYLYHFPILIFLISILNYNTSNIYIVSCVGFGVIIICYLLSLVTERKKYIYKKVLKKIFKENVMEELKKKNM